jgi:glutamate synthase (NADPH/NADH) small chain
MSSVNNPKNRWQAVQAAKQEPQNRTKNFGEVLKGYTEEQALAEASRCLNCSTSKCVLGCPVGVDIPSFIKLLKNKEYSEAITKIREKKQFTRHLRQSLPPRRTVPKKLHHGQKRQLRLHWTAGTFRSGFGA